MTRTSKKLLICILSLGFLIGFAPCPLVLASSPTSFEYVDAARPNGEMVEPSKGPTKDERDIADLKAQQAMVRWAAYMFWLTAVSVLITLAGLLLVWRTLHHTRRAADYAFDMVKEAQEATEAAKESVTVAREIGQAQARAYLSCSKARYEITKTGLNIWLGIRNYGQSPARDVKIEGGVRFSLPKAVDKSQTDLSDIQWIDNEECAVVAAGAENEEFVHIKIDDFANLAKGPITAPLNTFHLKVYLEWEDVFGSRHEAEFWLFPPIYTIRFVGAGPFVHERGELEVKVTKVMPQFPKKRSTDTEAASETPS